MQLVIPQRTMKRKPKPGLPRLLSFAGLGGGILRSVDKEDDLQQVR